jgi:dihydropteroate synthase
MHHIFSTDDKNLNAKFKLPLGRVFKVNNKILDLTKPNIMGILNITPDSFFDGGKYLDPDKALAKALKLVADGATIIDIGAESTRPNAPYISSEEELARLCPILDVITNKVNALISIDTSKPEVMEKVINKYNVDLINDVRALRERDGIRDSLNIIAHANIPVILMHMQGKPRNMQREPRYEHVLNEIYHFFQHRIEVCMKYGIKQSNIMIDPGFGFGKSWFDNASLLKYLAKFQALNCPIVVGMSRKSMITRNKKYNIPVEERLPASLALAVMAIERGASIIRCHDVAATKQAIDLAFDVLEDGNCIDE